MQLTRRAVHKWGARNRVTFAAEKEHIVVLHPDVGEGELVKLLGCVIDPKLNMQAAVDKLTATLRPKIKAMLRMKSTYDLQEMVRQFKTHIWGFLEYHCGSIAHATETVLTKLDRLHDSYLEALQLNADVAFLDFNFAPPRLRRDIAMLGFLHKRVIGQCHPAVKQFLPFLAMPSMWHNKQLEPFLDNCIKYHRLHERSLFGMIHVYNRLHQSFVDLETVKGFQRALTDLARARCRNKDPRWHLSFHSSAEIWTTRRFLNL